MWFGINDAAKLDQKLLESHKIELLGLPFVDNLNIYVSDQVLNFIAVC
jgi:hypothetical protein